MLNDEYLLQYMTNMVYESDETQIATFVSSQKAAIEKYNTTNANHDYFGECNHKLATFINPDSKQKCIDILITEEQYRNNYCGKQGYDVFGKGYECCSVHTKGITDLSGRFNDYDCMHSKADKD